MKVICPHCNADVDTLAGPGAIVQCPHCTHMLTLPGLSAPPPLISPESPWWYRALTFSCGMVIWDFAMVLVSFGAIIGLVSSFASSADQGNDIPKMVAVAGCASLLIQCAIYWAVRNLKADN